MHQEQSETSLSERFRHLVAPLVTLAALAIGGCGRTAEDIAKLPHIIPDEATDQKVALLHHEVAINGNPQFEIDKSYSYTDTVLMPMTIGKSTVLMPMPQTHTHYEYWYSLPCMKTTDGKLWLQTSSQFDPHTVTVSGTVEQLREGGIYIDVTGSLYQPEK